MRPTRASLATDRAGISRGTGWIPPVPDLRDYTEEHDKIQPLVAQLGIPESPGTGGLPAKADLREHCTPIEDQGQLGSCTANAAVGIVEYFEKRAFDRYIDGSRLFVYKATRNLMGVTGDTGAWLRNAMGALALCGVAPERYWPYTDDAAEFDHEPPPFVYAIADNFEALRYFCHDPIGQDLPRDEALQSVKRFLSGGIPAMFGFWGFSSFDDVDVAGGIPFPCPGEQAEWGHAIVAVGYDDGKRITNTRCNKKTKGALLIRNSWGEGWGDEGYGWLPYEYVEAGLALDFWSLISLDWVQTKHFGFEGV
jgi:C1A family cysteine protease